MLQTTTTVSNMKLINNIATRSSSQESRASTHNSTLWEYEEITIERGPAGLGFTVAGGTDHQHYTNNNNIYITRLIPNGPAHLDGRLKLEDIIVKVNETDLKDVKHLDAVTALKNSGSRVQLLIKRRKQPSSSNTYVSRTSSYLNSQKKQLPDNNTPYLFTSTLPNKQNQLPTLLHSRPASPRASLYSAKNDASFVENALKLRSASSTESLQQADETVTTKKEYNYSENHSHTAHSKSIPAKDFDAAKGLSRLPRTVILQRTQKGLGFNIVGGVAGGGTFISYIVPNSAAERSGKLHCGDKILSVNGTDLRLATHEEAASALKQAGQTVKLVVKHRPEEYVKLENKINDLRGRNMSTSGTLQTSQKRSLYARALFDYDPARDSGLPSKGLQFKFGDILHIINASDDEWWQAKRVLENGFDDVVHGIIPSKRRVERRERTRLKSVKFNKFNSSESTLDRRRKRITFSKKWPFMKSRENVGLDDDDMMGSPSNSRGILYTSSATSINNNNSERGSMKNFNEDVILSYEPVLQQTIDYVRPVALYGPVKEEIEELREELSCYHDRFKKMEAIVPYTTRPPKEKEIDGVKYHFVTMQEMKRDLARHKFVEAGEFNNNLYGTSIESIREVANSGKHCLLNISPKAIGRLRDANIFPIVVFIKPKSIELLMELNKRWSIEEAAAAIECANRLEQEYGSYFTATIQQESVNEILREINNIIENQSGPKIWIPTTFEALNVN